MWCYSAVNHTLTTSFCKRNTRNYYTNCMETVIFCQSLQQRILYWLYVAAEILECCFTVAILYPWRIICTYHSWIFVLKSAVSLEVKKKKGGEKIHSWRQCPLLPKCQKGGCVWLFGVKSVLYYWFCMFTVQSLFSWFRKVNDNFLKHRIEHP